MIQPGATLGLLGGGQLGRMFTQAAQRMGYEVIVLDPDPESPAGRIASRHIRADYTDEVGLTELGTASSAVTTEFENVPAASLSFLRRFGPVRPGPEAVAITQDRVVEKRFAQAQGLATVPFQPVLSLADCAAAPSLFYADWAHPIDTRHEHLRAYRTRLLARPSFARAVDEARPFRAFFPLGAPDRD